MGHEIMELKMRLKEVSELETKAERDANGYKVGGDCGGHLKLCFLKCLLIQFQFSQPPMLL